MQWLHQRPHNNRMTRERQVLLPTKRPTWAERHLHKKQHLDRAPAGGAGHVAVLVPLGRGRGDGHASAPSFLRCSRAA